MRREISILAAATLLFVSAYAFAAPETAASPLKRVLGKYTIYASERRAEVRATVCLTSGILDFFAVNADSGKEYESVLILEGQCHDLHAALLALGARPGGMPESFKGGAAAPPPKEPAAPGSRVGITLRWSDDKGEHTANAESWLMDRATKRPPEKLEWVFTGSFSGKTSDGQEVYVGDMERTPVGLWYRKACVLNAASAAGNPYRGDTLGFEVNTAAIPKVGTEVWVSFVLK
ncbi:MAG: YdjY domain-containing protein [Candidatus Brocadiia bacterium]|jgi:hypothetical protein